MRVISNILLYAVFASFISGCGGGNTTIASNNASQNSSGSTTGSTSGGSGSSSSSGSGSITLHWTAPTTRADNTAASLSDIAGYRLYYGKSATDTNQSVTILDGTATQYTITLPSGTYYFRIAAIDTKNLEGLKSVARQNTL